ncbi:MAG: hypothetical protein H6Q28_135, partial [Bacteroidetes bacterium]|nr:hypothetical protein [Bacteroidota bacterium]
IQACSGGEGPGLRSPDRSPRQAGGWAAATVLFIGEYILN